MSNCYLYLITDRVQEPPEQLTGICGKKIECLPCEGLWVWFSLLDSPAVDQSLEQLKIHNRVALAAMEAGTVLPFQFGTILKSQGDIHAVVRDIRIQIEDNLNKLAGKVEMGVKIFGSIPEEKIKALEEIDVIKRLSEVQSKTRSVQYLIKKVKATQRERVFEQYSKELYERLLEPLILLSKEVKPVKGCNEKILVNAAFLIDRGNLEAFKRKVEEIKEKHPAYSFLYSGPWPPYNFVKIIQEGKEIHG